jgi:hypothetical protein
LLSRRAIGVSRSKTVSGWPGRLEQQVRRVGRKRNGIGFQVCPGLPGGDDKQCCATHPQAFRNNSASLAWTTKAQMAPGQAGGAVKCRARAIARVNSQCKGIGGIHAVNWAQRRPCASGEAIPPSTAKDQRAKALGLCGGAAQIDSSDHTEAARRRAARYVDRVLSGRRRVFRRQSDLSGPNVDVKPTGHAKWEYWKQRCVERSA